MKKIFILFILSIVIFLPNQAFAMNVATSFDGNFEKNTLYEAKLIKVIDGDTARFNVFGKEYKVRFLFIDTPENTKEIEAYGQEATDFAKEFFSKGTIYLEIDNGNVFDKYDRLLAWVWVDDELFQEKITSAGLVKKFYDYDDYKYEDEIRAAMDEAKEQKLGIYSDESTNDKNFLEDQPILLAFIIIAGIISWMKRKKK